MIFILANYLNMKHIEYKAYTQFIKISFFRLFELIVSHNL